jgi:hypothetical protein
VQYGRSYEFHLWRENIEFFGVGRKYVYRRSIRNSPDYGIFRWVAYYMLVFELCALHSNGKRYRRWFMAKRGASLKTKNERMV